MVGDLAHAVIASSIPSIHGQRGSVKVAERLRDPCVSSLELMTDVAFGPLLGRQSWQQTAAWRTVKGRVVFPMSAGTGGIRRWVSAREPVEKVLFLVGKR
jgi:hypothetical protein